MIDYAKAHPRVTAGIVIGILLTAAQGVLIHQANRFIDQQGVMNERVIKVARDMDWVKAQLGGIYTERQAASDWATQRQVDKRQDERISLLSKRVENLERH